MADGVNYLAGKIGYVIVTHVDGDEEYPLGEWSVAAHADFIKRNTFMERGYQTGVSGFKSVKLSVKGPFPFENTPIDIGEQYWIVLGLTEDGPLEFQCLFHITDITPSNNAEGAPEVDISADSMGEFEFTDLWSQ